jgi:chemotaxis protein CheD
MSNMDNKIIQVNIGQAKFTSSGQTLQTILGSCVGIGLLLPEKKLFGLAHCLLPLAPPDERGTEARFVDHAVPLLLELMGIIGPDARKVEAVLVGGGCMLGDVLGRKSGLIGSDNVLAARQVLKQKSIRIVFEDVGGHFGRQLFIHGDSGSYDVKKILRSA